MRTPFRSVSCACGMLCLWACGGDDSGAAHPSSSVTTGSSSATTSGPGGATGSGGTMATSSTTGSSVGAGGTSGGGGGSNGGAGSNGAPDASIDGSPMLDAATGDRNAEGGPVGVAGCDQNNYALCLDFEKGMDPKWTGWTANLVQMGKAAHGNGAFHGPPGGMLTTTQLGAITNVVWGRFYLHMTPGAPMGHGEMVGVYDQANNWYEVGWEFNGLQGNWHGNGGEKYMRTKTRIPDAYICLEFLFDGATPAVARIWQDGQEIQYYDVSPLMGPNKVTRFTKIEIGFRPFHSLSLVSYDGQNPPLMTDIWIDDIAFDTQRIGCIAP